MRNEKLRNVAIIAHVDLVAAKSAKARDAQVWASLARSLTAPLQTEPASLGFGLGRGSAAQEKEGFLKRAIRRAPSAMGPRVVLP